MPEPIGPAIARERLRARLRELRESSGLSSADVSERLTWPASAIDEVESGARPPSPPEVEALLGLYGVGSPEDERLILLARASRSRLWWARHRITDEYQDLVAYEAEIARTSTYQPLLVPGILQTRRYALAATAAILRLSPDDPDVVARADIRGERARHVAARAEAGDPLEIVAILEEAALRRVIGDGDVMREQLDLLVTQAGLPYVTLVALPAALGGHAGLAGGFELIEPADDPRLAAVFIESATRDQIIREPRATAYYRETVDELVAVGRGGEDAIALLRSIRDEFGS
ncbi:MAG: DUF5753 domain-containing protein [Jiangellaceae bacterium]